MNANMGTIDRAARFVIGAALIIAPLINLWGLGQNATTAYVLMAVGAVLALTSVVSFCPLYRLMNISTTKP